MANEWISIQFENEDEILARLDEKIDSERRRIRSLLDEISKAGMNIIRANTPIYSSYTLRHVDRTAVTWSPGGEGGGGSYQQTVGIKSGTSRHPLYAEFGTGLYGAVGWYIVPLRAQYMTFYGSRARRILHKKSVKGQKPQHYFYQSWHELLVYAQARVLGSIH
jgi:hypothetical protein